MAQQFLGGRIPTAAVFPSFTSVIQSNPTALLAPVTQQIFKGSAGLAVPAKPGQYFLGLDPSFFGVATNIGINQIVTPNGGTFLAQAGKSLAANLAANAINVGLNRTLGTNILSTTGLDLSDGKNFLASSISPFITSTLSSQINQTINNTLRRAGPFGPLLSQVASGFVAQATFGGTTNTATKMFPGGGGGEEADYGGFAYNLGPQGGDVVFSIQPANQGPQSFGLSEAIVNPKSPTTLKYGQSLSGKGLGVDAFDPKNQIATEKVTKLTGAAPTVTGFTPGLGSRGQLDATAFNSSKPLSLTSTTAKGWTFICAPKEISWDQNNAVDRVKMFGTNAPPVVSGTRGMRDLVLSDALVEGFTRGLSVESKVAALEELTSYGLNTSQGFVDVPVYQVKANDKTYGGSEAYFVIKDVKVKELLRDLKGNSTRAVVDVSFMEVPKYQVSSGRDQASETVNKVRPGFDVPTQASQGINATNAAGPSAPSPAPRR